MRVQLASFDSQDSAGLCEGVCYSGIAFYIKDNKPVSYNPKQYERIGPSYGSGPFAAWRMSYDADKLGSLFTIDPIGSAYGRPVGPLLFGEVFSREFKAYRNRYGQEVNFHSHRGDVVERMRTTSSSYGVTCHYEIFEVYMMSPTKPAVRYTDFSKYYRTNKPAKEWSKEYLLSFKEDVMTGTKKVEEDYLSFSTCTWTVKDINLPDPSTFSIAKPQVIPEFYNNWELVKAYNWVSWNFERGLSTAKVDAVDKMPQINMGFLGNLMELVSIIKSLMEVRKGKISMKSFRSVRDAVSSIWLTKRYAIDTTKSDIEEYEELFSRLIDLCQTDLARFHGEYTDEGITFSVSFSLDTDKIVPSNIKEVLSTFGAKPSIEDLWDIIPYSFIVDWFLGIGDTLAFLTNYKMSLTLPIKDLWVSIKSLDKDWYFRFQPDSLPALPYLVHPTTSTKTWLMRLTDVFALIL